MPYNYPNNDPSQGLSSEQIEALAEVQKIIVAKVLYNRNLLQFMLDDSNAPKVSAFLNDFAPHYKSAPLDKKLKVTIKTIIQDIKNYQIYSEYIKSCKTTVGFDDLFFQFLLELGSQQFNLNRMSEGLKSTRTLGASKKQLLVQSKICAQEFTELESYQEICNILVKHISMNACTFKQHYQCTYISNDTDYGTYAEVENTFLNAKLCPLASKLNNYLKFQSKNFTTEQSKEHLKLQEKYLVIDKLIKSSFETSDLSVHAFNSFGSFVAYRKVRYFFDLNIDFLHTAKGFLISLEVTGNKKNKLLEALVEIEQLTGVLETSTSASEPEIEMKFSNEFSLQEELFEKPVSEVVPSIVEHVKEPVIEKELSTTIPHNSDIKEKSENINRSLIEIKNINPAIEFIIKLDYKESEMLLEWLKKAPHMEVEMNELNRIVKKLEGEIINSATRGSHYTIKFKKSLAFVDSFEENTTKGTEKKAKGTLVRPHGPGKSSRFLPSYAIKTFMETLGQMGVTQPILDAYTKGCMLFHRMKSSEKEMNPLIKIAQREFEKIQNDQSKMLLFLKIYKGKTTVNISNEKKQLLAKRICSFLQKMS